MSINERLENFLKAQDELDKIFKRIRNRENAKRNALYIGAMCSQQAGCETCFYYDSDMFACVFQIDRPSAWQDILADEPGEFYTKEEKQRREEAIEPVEVLNCYCEGRKTCTDCYFHNQSTKFCLLIGRCPKDYEKMIKSICDKNKR